VRAPRHALGVAREHLDVREQVVRERHRLRDLQVREARHDRLDVCCAASSTSARCTSASSGGDAVDLVAQPQAHVGRDLVVARAAGVQALAGVAGELDQARLDVEVTSSSSTLPLERAAPRSLR
jgi:hypothetical protein